MARIYAELIRKGLKTIDEVPKALRKQVEDLLVDEGQKGD